MKTPSSSSDTYLHIRIPPKIHTQLKILSARLGLSMTDVVITLLKERFNLKT